MEPKQIPNYGLYGELLDISAPVAVHIEAIADRSPDLDWVIKPHRHGKLYQVLCVFDGQLDVQLDDIDHHLNGTWLVTVPVGVVHGFRFKPNSNGVVISLAEEFIRESGFARDSEYLAPIFENAGAIEFTTGDEQETQLQTYVELIRHEFSALNSGKLSSLLLLIRLLLITVKRQVERNTMDTFAQQSNIKLLDTFRRLVEQHYKNHWQVKDYANQLNISTSTLNRMCHERFATNAKSIIASRMLAEAKRRLIFTRQPLDQIAYNLGYKDPAYFSRVFKKSTGQAPGEFRKIHHREL